MNIPEIKRVNFETSAGASLKVFLEFEALNYSTEEIYDVVNDRKGERLLLNGKCN